jgi:hypothetical protein
LNQADVDRALIPALHIRQSGAWAADLALTGKGTDKEVDALLKQNDALEESGILQSHAAIDRGKSSIREQQTPDEQVRKILKEIREERLTMQMFDPPITGRSMVTGCPVLSIPNSEEKYPNLLAWWTSVGRLKPRDPQGWSTLSGPGVMNGRVEIIDPVDWAALPTMERELITSWARTWPCEMFFD